MLPKNKSDNQIKTLEGRLKQIPTNIYVNKSVYTPQYLLYFKSFCIKCLKSLEIEKGFEKIKSNCLNTIVYSANSDVIYIYLEDKYTAEMLMETLSHYFLSTDPLFKGSTMDSDTKGVYIVELNYLDEAIIYKNKENNLKNIIV